MRTDPGVLSLLQCVRCTAPLCVAEAREHAGSHLMEGRLGCTRCAADYLVVRGVPRFATSPAPAPVEQTVSGFGYQWRRANEPLRHARFNAPETFLDFIRPVERGWFRDKVVLDAGCGGGRFTRLAADFGATFAVGVDLSASVDVAFENTRDLDNVLIVQADILRLPVRTAFDYVFSVGVLHHTADPRRAFLEVCSKVRPGGGVSAWVYGRENNGWIVYGLNPVRRLTSLMPRPLLLLAAHLAAIPLTLAVRLVYGPVARRPSLHWLRRWLFYFDYMAFLADFGYREHAFIIFDHAVPSLAAYVPRASFAEWFESAGLREITISSRAGNSWRGFGRVSAT